MVKGIPNFDTKGITKMQNFRPTLQSRNTKKFDPIMRKKKLRRFKVLNKRNC